MPIIIDMEEITLANKVSSPFTFVKFASLSGKAAALPPAPPPSIIDDGDGMAHISPDIVLDTSNLDAGLKRLIAAVFGR